MNKNDELLPGEKILDELLALRKKLEDCPLTPAIGLREARGRECPFYQRGLRLFYDLDYKQVSSMIKSLYALVLEIEEQDG